MSSSFGDEVKVIERQKWGSKKWGVIEQLCIGGYEFVLVCREKKGQCYFGETQNFQITQIITENGGGKKC